MRSMGSAASIALVACLGCSSAAESGERKLWTVNGAPGDPGGPAASGAKAPSDPSPPETSRPGVTLGELRSSFSSSARGDVCITLAEDAAVEAIDEYFCEPLPADARGPRARCAGCEMEYRAARDGSWMLAARPGAEACTIFAGTYRLLDPPAGHVPRCMKPFLTPCGDTYCAGECDIGADGTAVCVEAKP